MRLKLFLISLLATVSFFAATKTVKADENFSTALASTYSVSATGTTTVTQKFTITNKKPTLFAKQYAVEVGSGKIKNVRAFDSTGDLPSNVVTTNDKTSIAITFADKIVGEGKSRDFTLQFEYPDAAVLSGNVLEVYIPKLTNARQYEPYTVTLKTPASFGEPARITPKTYTTSQENNAVVLHFDSIGEQGISALFGQQQLFDFSIGYVLNNPTGSVGIIQIALPPDTARQKVQYTQLEPQPTELNRDLDGNWIATYQIEAQKNVHVSVAGTAQLSLEAAQNLNLPAPNADWTAAQKYWETGSPTISDLAKKYSTPKTIYDYVVSALTYNYNKVGGSVERLGALGALAAPTNAACQEFTDLFIAIARAAGIPTRRVTGYAYTANNRLRPLGLDKELPLHAWPEYYDQARKEWFPIDPTWGNTTGGVNYFDQFDFNHLALAINGLSSTTPYTAGAYKSDQQADPEISVRFGRTPIQTTPSFSWTITRTKGLSNLLGEEYELTLKNLTGTAWYNVPIKLEIDGQSVSRNTLEHTKISPQQQELDYILPFQTRTIHFSIQTQNPVQTTPLRLTASVYSLSSSHDLIVGITKETFTQPTVLAIGLVIGLVIITLVTWRVLVYRRTRQYSLRR